MNKESRKKQAGVLFPVDPAVKWFILFAVVAIFLVLLHPSLIVQEHVYKLGDIAERDIKAKSDFFIEDQEATEASRKQIVEQVLTVYDFDPSIMNKLTNKVRAAFDEMRHMSEPSVPLVDMQAPSIDSAQDGPTEAQAREDRLWAKKETFESLLGLPISQGAFKLLIDDNFSAETSSLAQKILQDILNNGVVGNKEVLLRENDKGVVLRNTATQSEKRVLSLRQYYGTDQAKTMVRIVAEPLVRDLHYNLINLVVDLCQRLIQPNITVNRNETEERKKAALQNIKPVMYQIKAGEMILREGERVSHIHMLKLSTMKNQADKQKIATSSLGAAAMLSILLIVLHRLYLQQPRHAKYNKNRHLLFISVALVLVFFIVKMGNGFIAGLFTDTVFRFPESSIVYAIPVAAGAMLICLFLGFEIAVPFSLVAAMCAALLLDHRFELFVFFFINNIAAAYWVKQCRERKGYIKASAKLGLLNIVLASVISIYASDYTVMKLVWDWPLAFMGGVVSGIITLGTAPVVEMCFNYTTDISLLESANLDRPLLRRLMLEAPGTYHHSVIVGSLAEAAAAEIGANPLLGKVCGYYHDIGKVKKPLYFIENQKDGRNKHDKLAPSMSGLILIAHVKDGIDIARTYKLGQDIIDTISQHHGTSLISYFFDKAKQLKGEDAVKIDDYRYPGPKPQTKEAGLVMLADIVEAASRTLENPTPARIQGLVQHLINKVFSDGQLDNCELTLKDLHSIAKSFNKILYGIHHHRIEYADSPTRENGKGKNGSTDRQSTGKTPDRDQPHSKESTGHLKRLGLS